MKNRVFFLASLLTLCGAAHAVGTITGLTAIPANPVAGEPVKYKITTTGSGSCGMRLIYAGANYEPSDNMLINNQPAAGGVMDKTISKAGTYNLKAVGSPSLDPKCNGEASLTVIVKEKPAPAAPAASGGGKPPAGAGMGAMQPQAPVVVLGTVPMSEAMTCPSPYTRHTEGMDAAKGEALCIKSDATCLGDYISNRNQQTGQLTCVPKVPVGAPDGWTHASGDGNGVLVFNSIPQPTVKCPKSTSDWQWGTTYYKESWNRMGCRANLKPAY
jgi:hypothetical protein